MHTWKSKSSTSVQKMKQNYVLLHSKLHLTKVPPFCKTSEVYDLMLNSPFEVYHTCLFTFITEILTWLELLQRIILISGRVLGETWQNLTATFPLHPRDWQKPSILLGSSTSSQQDGPFKIKPKHTKIIIYFINKHIKVGFVAAFPSLVFWDFS